MAAPKNLNYKQRAQRAALAAQSSWANTPDRTVRTGPARSAGPGSDAYWVDLKRSDPKFAEATAKQILDAAMAAKSAHFKRMAFQSAKVRGRRGDAA